MSEKNWDPTIQLPPISYKSYWQVAPMEKLAPASDFKVAHGINRPYEYHDKIELPFLKALKDRARHE